MSLNNSEFDFSVIRTLRQKEGLTIKDMVQRTGLTPSTIVRVEKNECNPTANTLASIGRVLKKPPSELIRLAEGVRVVQASADYIDFPVPNTKKFTFSNVAIYLVDAPKGTTLVSPPAIHSDSHEIFCLRKGKLRLRVHDRGFELEEGDAIMFDALFTHSVDAIEDCSYVVVQIPK